MEYVDSPSLEQRQTDNKCNCSDKAFVILSDVASALQFMHASKLVHNDIKPANILYHKTRGAIVIDFGLGGGIATECTGGTPWYLPPEYLVSRRNRRGPPSDVFALGVTMLWVLGKCPLPDRAHKVWRIADIQGLNASMADEAAKIMRTWLQTLEQLRLDLDNDASSVECVVQCMLAERGIRSTAEDVLSRLKSLPLK